MNRKEKIFFLFLFFVYTFGFFFFPYFPLARFTQFADAPRTYNDFAITTEKGTSYPSWSYGLGINYDGDPAMSQGRIYKTGNPWGEDPTQESIEQHLRLLRQWNWINDDAVCLEKRTWGTGEDGRFGLMKSQKWLWKNGGLEACTK
jgi:hypothetical protein